MFFFFSKVLTFLLSPLSWIFVIFVLLLLVRKPLIKKRLLIAGFMLFLLFTNPMIAALAFKHWEYPPTAKSDLPFVRTGVVLGGMLDLNSDISDQLHFNHSAERLLEPLTLLQSGLLQQLIISGGSGSILHPEQRESLHLRRLIESLKLSGNVSVEVDSISRNTYENAVEVSNLLKSTNQEGQPVLLITSAYHMRRAIQCFQAQGLEVEPFPVDYQTGKMDITPALLIPSAEAIILWNVLLKEWVGILAYRMAGYI